ncbi:MAG: sigma-54-dependent Fis family transcriptional regulator [Ignavibacteria bacterium]|jgi:transcriptional regulator with PAS, ATPase and Fis domain|nr:sigma-54-dependent Fis family transcriptional regulator [Ignavibacteria bacterium]MCU7502880.1 sigma-54-dependent Fis family transcriptional regulator [Ignavibacteria bacterium]MCU7515626.1 sigma-54-dependent Fis family transcriptional regulator [Ignavibacteria bacterium]
MKNTKLKILPLEDNNRLDAKVSASFYSSGSRINNMLLHVEVLRGQMVANSRLLESERHSILTELDMLRGQIVSFSPVSNVYGISEGTGAPEFEFPNFIGKNPKIMKLLTMAVRFAKTGYPILITGETGTGKEVFARVIHQLSKKEKFLPVNCGAIPEQLIESELFGYQKGSFTGASGFRPGKFEEADGGTIFLDEIGELNESTQVKLLRVLQFGEIQKIGLDRTVNVDVRVIAATNKNLSRLMEQGKFREDLYYRLSVCEIYMPPLRERKDEIPLLLEHFLGNISRELNLPVPELGAELKEFLFSRYDYPGNIRELENIAKLIIALTPEGSVSSIEHLTETYQNRFNGINKPIAEEVPAMGNGTKSVNSKDSLEKMMTECKGEIKQVAKAAGLSFSRIYQLCTKYNIHPSSFKEKR